MASYLEDTHGCHLGQLRPQRLRDVVHIVEGSRPPLVYPLQHLKRHEQTRKYIDEYWCYCCAPGGGWQYWTLGVTFSDRFDRSSTNVALFRMSQILCDPDAGGWWVYGTL